MKIWIYVTNDEDNHNLINISRLSQYGCTIQATSIDGKDVPIAFFKEVKEATMVYKSLIDYIKQELKFTTRENLFIDFNVKENTINSQPFLKQEQRQQQLDGYELVR